jgi:hypothetical protein
LYQWFVNGLPSGSGGETLSLIPAEGDQVYVVMTSNLPCVSGNPDTSNVVVLSVAAQLPVNVSIEANQNGVCEGTLINFTAIPENGGEPSFQWFVNDSPTGAGQADFSYVPDDGDRIFAIMTSSLTCVSGNPDTSNIVIMDVALKAPVSVTIQADQNPVCSGNAVTFTAIPVNGGDPTYQWQVNGQASGSGGPSFSYTPVTGDEIYVIMSSSLTCATGSPDTSDVVVMSVTEPLPASVTITSNTDTICEGETVTFVATPVNGGSPAFHWFVNGLPAGQNEPTFTFIPSEGDVVHTMMISSLSCVSGNPSTSNSVVISVRPSLQAGVSITLDQNPVCQGSPVKVTAHPVNGGNPAFQWYVNNSQSGANQPEFTFVPSEGDRVFVVMTSGELCITGNPAVSDTVSIGVVQIPGTTGSISGPAEVCSGSQGVLYAVSPVSGATGYEWSVPPCSSITSGQGTATISVSFVNSCNEGEITVRAVNDCGNGPDSPPFHFIVNPIPAPPVVTLDWPELTSNVPAGNQWYCGDTLIVGATGQTYTATRPGWYWAVVSENGCVSDTSNHVWINESDPAWLEPGIKVYPVPNDGRFTISIVLLAEETFDITIYNSLGEKVYEKPDLFVKNTYKEVVNLQSLRRGLYSVFFKCKDYEVVKKMIIDKK